MSRGVLVAMGFLLAAAAWKVYDVRGKLSDDESDPAAIARLQQRLSAIPLQLEGYRGTPSPLDPQVARMAGADTFTSVDYVDPAGHPFHLYVGGAVRNQENFHAPSYCLPAAGWEVLEQSTVPFAFPVGQEGARMRRLLLQHGDDRMIVYYWFQAGGSLSDHEWKVRYRRFLDLLASRRFPPALIVTVYAPVGESVSEAEAALRSFLGIVGPAVHRAVQGAS